MKILEIVKCLAYIVLCFTLCMLYQLQKKSKIEAKIKNYKDNNMIPYTVEMESSLNELINYLNTRKSVMSFQSKVQALNLWIKFLRSLDDYKINLQDIELKSNYTLSQHRSFALNALKHCHVYDEDINKTLLSIEKIDEAFYHLYFLLFM